MRNLNILIVGAGIGGLTSALCLARKGHSVTVLEQSDVGDSGAGIQLSPNCSRVLYHLGLEAGLSLNGCQSEGTEIRDWKSAELIASFPFGMLRQLTGFPYYHIGRDDLIRLLLEKVLEEPLIDLRRNTRVIKFVQCSTGVSVSGEDIEISGDVLLGADGIHSRVKQVMFGDSKPRFTGNYAWRASIPAEKLPSGFSTPVAKLWWGPKKHFVHYPIKRGKYLSCVGIVENESWDTEQWTAIGEHREFLNDFENWHEDIVTLIECANPLACYKWGLFDRYPLTSWSVGRVALLGDACHPTLPFLAQGAAMAIEDAAVITDCLERCEELETGLKLYESLRKKRTTRIQSISRQNATIFHMSGLLARLRDKLAPIVVRDRMHWIYKYDPLSAV